MQLLYLFYTDHSNSVFFNFVSGVVQEPPRQKASARSRVDQRHWWGRGDEQRRPAAAPTASTSSTEKVAKQHSGRRFDTPQAGGDHRAPPGVAQPGFKDGHRQPGPEQAAGAGGDEQLALLGARLPPGAPALVLLRRLDPLGGQLLRRRPAGRAL